MADFCRLRTLFRTDAVIAYLRTKQSFSMIFSLQNALISVKCVSPALSVMLITCTTSLSCFANGWSEDFLGLTGTSVVFNSPIVQHALTNNQAPDLGQLLQKTGMKPWAGARIWLVQSIDNKIEAFPSTKTLEAPANRRGLLINTTLNEADKIPLQQILAQPKTGELYKLLMTQRSDALVVLSIHNGNYTWQLIAPPQRYVGTVPADSIKYLPHIWSENLALAYQWPSLKKNILIEIKGLRNINQFKAAETALKIACTSVQTLQVAGQNSFFACQSTNNIIPEKLKLIPQLVAQPSVNLGLDESVVIGQQLAQRYIAFQWRDFY